MKNFVQSRKFLWISIISFLMVTFVSMTGLARGISISYRDYDPKIDDGNFLIGHRQKISDAPEETFETGSEKIFVQQIDEVFDYDTIIKNQDSTVKITLEQPKYVVVDDNFSDIQLPDTVTPIYDHYTLEQRREKNLPIRLPQTQPVTSKKTAYLTFDDGPDPKNTPKILDILKQNGIKATFFVCGNMVDTYPEMLKRIFDEGHAIGNHTYNHNYSELYPSVNNFLWQLEQTDQAIFETIGVRPLIIRAPGGTIGVFNANYDQMLEKNGYVEYDWNVDSEDAHGSNVPAQELIRQVDIQTQQTFSHDSAIILMHNTEAKSTTVEALPAIIKILKDRGYSFGVITPQTPQPW